MKKNLILLAAIYIAVFVSGCSETIDTTVYETSVPSVIQSTIEPSASETAEAPTEQARAELQQKIDYLLRSLSKSEDDMTGTTFYTPDYKNWEKHDKLFYPYLVVTKNGSPRLRLVIDYRADDWLFINHYLIKVNEDMYTITPEGNDLEQDVLDGGSIKERADMSADDDIVEILKAINSCQSGKIRCYGEYHNDEWEFTNDELDGIADVLKAYDLMSGNTDPEGIPLPATTSSIPDVRNVKWGMNIKEVKETEDAQYALEGGNELTYSLPMQLGNNEVIFWLNYYFDNDESLAVASFVLHTRLDYKVNKEVASEFCNLIINQYSEPSNVSYDSDKTAQSNTENEINLDIVASGKKNEIVVFWENNTTSVSLRFLSKEESKKTDNYCLFITYYKTGVDYTEITSKNF